MSDINSYMKMHTEYRQRNTNLDSLRLFCAFFVICIHDPFPGEVGQYIIAIARFAVPSFLIISGYFYDEVVQRGVEDRQLIKLLKLIIGSNIFYFLWNIFLVCISGESISSYLISIFNAKSLLQTLIFSVSPFSGHLWYLNALFYVLILYKVLSSKRAFNFFVWVTPFLLIIDLIFGKYSLLIWNRELPVEYLRNWLFVGIPYFTIGRVIKTNETRIRQLVFKTGLNKYCEVVIILFVMSAILERAVLVYHNVNATRDHYFSTTLLAISVFIYCIMKTQQVNKLSNIGKKETTVIYIVHPAIITFIFLIEKYSGINDTIIEWANPIIVFICAHSVALLHNILKDKIKYSFHR